MVVGAAVVVVGSAVAAGAGASVSVGREPDSSPPTKVAAAIDARTMAPAIRATRTGDSTEVGPGQASARTTMAPV